MSVILFWVMMICIIFYAKGSIRIYKDGKNKMIFESDLDKYIQDGWQLGMKPKKHS